MFNKTFFALAVALAVAGPSYISASPVASLDGLEARGGKAKSSDGGSVPTVTTRYCRGANVMEKKTQNGKVVSDTVHTSCSPPLVCVEYGNGQIKCGKNN